MPARPAPAQPTQPGLRERKKAKTRAAIQGHALRLIREQGYDATTIEQIITAAEVSESTFFRYFPTKEAVVLADDFDPRLVAALQAQPATLAPIPAVRAAFRDAFATLEPDHHAELRARISLISTVPALRAAMLDQLAQTLDVLAAALADRTARRPDDFAVRTVAGAILGVMMAVLAAMTDDPTADLASLVDEGLGELAGGLRL